VIKLKDILKNLQEEEEPDKERKSTSWLDECGKFYPVPGHHHAYAIRITGTFNDPESILWRKGWQRITYYSTGTLFTENHYMFPNDIQKRKLIDLVMDLGFNELRYDGGKKSIILWSKEDILQEVK